MDHQLLEFIRDRFDSLDEKFDRHMENFQEHIQEDVRYWKKIDQQYAQLSLLQRLFVSAMAVASIIIGWLGLKH